MVVRIADLNNPKKEEKKGVVRLGDIIREDNKTISQETLQNEKVSMMREPTRAPALSVPETKKYDNAKTKPKKEEPKKSKFMEVVGNVGQALDDISHVVPSVLSSGLTERTSRALGQETLEEQQARAKRPGGIAGEVIAQTLPTGKAVTAIGAIGKNLPKLGRIAAQTGVGAGVGAASQVPLEIREQVAGINNQTLGQRAQDVGIAGAVGGALPIVGHGLKAVADKTGLSKKASDIINRWKPQPKPEPTLALPGPSGQPLTPIRGTGNPNRAVTDDVITPPHTFKLQEPSARTVQELDNTKQAWNDLVSIDDEIRVLNSRYQGAVQDQYKYLKNSMKNRQGVQQGQLHRDKNGNVIGRTGRISNNPVWYQEFFKANGRAPNNKELMELARKHVDEGYQEGTTFVPSWKAENAYDETVEALSQVRDTIRNTMKERGLNLTDATLKDQVFAGKRTPMETPDNVIKQVQAEAAPAAQVIEFPKARVENVPTPPRKPVQQTNERGFVTTLKESEKLPETLKERLSAAYKPLPNSVTVERANARVAKNLDEAFDYVQKAKVLTAEHVTTAHRLIDEYTKSGQLERAVEVVEKVAEMGTRAGQAIQAFSLYERLSPEGVLLYAQRVANKVNDRLPITADRVSVTPQIAANLTELAGTVQKMTGVKGAANDVMNILDRAKAGEKLTGEETELLQKFIKDAKAFVKETKPKNRTPRPPKPPSDKLVKEKVVSFLDAQEQAAKDRLRANGIRISSMPLDIYADYAIVGAAKMAKGVIQFADWSEQMIKEYGEQIRPYINELYEKASDVFNQTNKGISKQKLSQVERITERVLNNGKATAEEAEAIREIARRVSGLSGEAKNVASQDLQFILNQLDHPSTLQKISSFQTIAQLLNPKTLLTRNPLGNELFYRLERMNKYIASPIDWGKSLVTGGPRTVTFRTNNQGEYWKNWLIGAKAGWRGVNPEGISTQYDIQSPAFTSKKNPLHYMEKALGASLKSFDYASYKRAVNQTIGEMATLRAMNEGLKGEARKTAIQKYIREADENMVKIADEYGKYITFQDNNPISVGLQKFKRGLNFGKEWGIGDMVIKYPKTPGALLMRALEYSPAGFLRSAYILAGPLFKREPNPREVTLALSRAIVGTAGLSGLGFFLADKGIITGAANKDRDVRDLQRAAGQGQYQVNLSALGRWAKSGFDPAQAKIKEGDTLYTYDWMQPVAVAVSIGANVNQNMKENATTEEALKGAAGSAYAAFEGGANTLVEQSLLQGVRTALGGYPGQTVGDKITDILIDVPSSFAPTVANQIRQTYDNAQRETYSPNKLEESFNKVKAKIPEAAKTLPKRFDTLGNEKQTMQDNNLFNVFLNPGYQNKYKLSPEAKLVVDIIEETKDTSAAPRVPGKTLTIKQNGKTERIKLTGEQFSRIQQLTGELTRKELSKINSNMRTDNRLKKIQEALNKAGDKARDELRKEIQRGS